MSLQEQQDKSQYFYRASAAEFMKIPGSPVAYWAPKQAQKAWEGQLIRDVLDIRSGLLTGNDQVFQRHWYEINYKDIFSNTDDYPVDMTSAKWVLLTTGGEFRKWYGNIYQVVNAKSEFYDIRNLPGNNYRLRDSKYYFRNGVNWPMISSANYGAKISPNFAIMGNGVRTGFPNGDDLSESFCAQLAGYLSSNVAFYFMSIINPTLNFNNENVEIIPYVNSLSPSFLANCKRAVDITKADWDSTEFSKFFNKNKLIEFYACGSVEESFKRYIEFSIEITSELLCIEEGNNREVISYFGLSDFVSDKVSTNLITLNFNPAYKYNSIEESFESNRLRSDIFAELLSYLIGCMMGRYSIDKPGLILASQGETLQDYLNQIPSPRFMPDSDAILPLTDQEWFADDVTNRVREFVKVVWGEETLQENLAFIAESLCLHAIKPKKSEGALDTIRRYLSTQFYKDHLKTYKKRPIYWLFSSGKEKAFECLVYLHRYNESTLARMRTEYVTPLMGKYDAQHSLLLEQKTDASPAQQRELEKELKALEKKQTELRAFDEQLKHYADMRIKLDLDDGVKVNYGKFGNLLAEVKAITGDKE
ncbi:MAG: BREX-1 system adenine-specific DNA-methyltransferase PglX [Alishewanella agri]|nr:BREX-1 system adenine-specific DNA-methyltransferase PglX [Alishewanella agri]